MKSITFTFYACLILTLTASSQTLSWARQMGGTSDDMAFSIAVDAAGNQYITGYFAGTADFDPGPGTFNLTSPGGDVDIFVVKLDATGNFIWAKQMGGSIGDAGKSIAVDASGNVYITGSFSGTSDFDPGPGIFNLTSAGSWDIFICKLNSSGNFLWAKRFGASTQEDHGNAITVDASGNVYATGSFKGTIDFDPGPGTYPLTADYIDVFVLKLDASGNFIWAKKMGGIFTDVGNSIAVDASGNVYTTGYFVATADFDPDPATYYLVYGTGDEDGFISKLDASGNFVWVKHFSPHTYDNCYSNGIAVDASGNVYTTGSFKGTTDFDPGPGTFNLVANGLNDGFVCKLNSSGDFVWAKKSGGCQEEDYGTSVAVDASGNVYTTGVFQYYADFDPGTGIYELHADGATDVYISKLNASGNFVWAIRLGGTNPDYCYSIVVDASGNIFTAGFFKGTADFDPGTGILNFVSAGGNDIFVSKLNQPQPLPVKFSDLKAYQQDNGIRLEWSNLTESEVIGYIVERAGVAQPFEALASVAPMKNDGGRADYSFFDASPQNGINLYRVQSQETDGKKLYSIVVKVDRGNGKTGIDIYPNPVTNNQLTLQATELPKGLYRLRIFNAGGQQVHSVQLNINAGSVSEMIQLPASLKAGVYHLQVSNDELKLGKTFMVQ
ncbi:MAG: SBBP repeat-containing protein [Bacteroidota bacterium]|nr:SBBP repeat-containing protein [Bacteroidota bacterium]